MLAEIVKKHASPIVRRPEKNNTDIKSVSTGMFGVEKLYIDQFTKQDRLSEYRFNYSEIDLSFLSMRKNDWPLFAIFSLDDPYAHISLRCDFRDGVLLENISCEYSIKTENYKKYFKDIYKKLYGYISLTQNSSRETITVRAKCLFKGVIPQHARDLIRDNQNKFDEIFLIGEADEWSVQKEHIIVQPRNPDPLIIGVKDGVSFLIGAFDLTLLETGLESYVQ